MGGSKPWPQVPVGNRDHTNAAVVIIGAGISGLCMAIDLIKRNNCHNFVIVEKSSGVGGTWHDNKYPGCCCDVSSQLYSYSFEQNPDWSRLYPGQEEIQEYLIGVAEKYRLYKYIRFNTSAEEARWDDEELKWKVDVKVSGDKDSEFNERYTITSDFLVSAVGQLNQPAYPNITGIEEFQGKLMHSARWDWSYDLSGKRIAVIGNGATAAQIVPELIKTASSVTVYQRTPNWVMPRLDGPIPSYIRSLYRYMPPLLWRTRALQMDMREEFYEAVTDSESKIARQIRGWCSDAMRESFPNQPEIWDKLTPAYSPGCKRVIISDDYYPALAAENCRLETASIKRITASSIEVEGKSLATGEENSKTGFDLIVLATGFRTIEFLHPIQVTGAENRLLTDIWAKTGGATALYGTTVPSLPNFGMFYGPNTNLGHNSIVLMIEAQSRYISALVNAVLTARSKGTKAALHPKEERVRAFNEEVQKKLGESSFADDRCNSWYKNKEGRITNNWSGTVVEYQNVLSKVDWEDFELVEGGKEQSGVMFGKKTTKLGRVREETRLSNTALLVGVLGAVATVGGVVWDRRRRSGKARGWW